ncbi:MAG: 50S ribosomal protein L25 [Candidatus Nomurabacteria bacterium]|nr:MAG: 50S ribosomal protein L25 [Candidatus Nomurabacteria bacterium]
MKTYVLQAQRRSSLGKQVKKLRQSDIVPAVIYGNKRETESLSLNAREFTKVFIEAGESTLIDLAVENEAPVKVLIHDVQHHPVTDRILHADLLQVDMTQKIETEINLKFVGAAPAVAELSGTLVTSIESVEVSCLPGDLVHEIEVDLSSLKTFEDQIHISDIPAPQGITILDKADAVVAVVTPPRSEEELKALDSEVVEDVSGVESTKPKKAEEEGEEASGDAKPDAGAKEAKE